MREDGGWEPEFAGQRAPFTPGHEASVKHGGFSERRVGPLAERIKAALLEDPDCPPFLHEGKFARALSAWSRAEALAELIGRYLDTIDIGGALSEVTEAAEDEDRAAPGTVRRRLSSRKRLSVLEALHRAESRAQSLRRELGLSPASYAQLAVHVGLAHRQQADAIEKLARKGAEIRERREAQLREAAERAAIGSGDTAGRDGG